MESFLKQYCSREWQEFVDFHKEIIEVEADTCIFREGDKTEGLYIINKGKVKVMMNAMDKSERLVRLAADGAILGHRGFGGNWTYSVSARTFEKTTLTFIPINIFNIIAKSNIDFTYNLMMFFAEELRRSEEKITMVPVKNRIAQAILLNYSVFGPDKEDEAKISLTLSRKDFASKVGTTYETVVRVLSDLNKSGLIQTVGKSIRILDFEELKTLANQKA